MILRAVVADDEPSAMRQVLRALADIPRLEVVAWATDGPHAARLITEHRPEIAILDVGMPGQDGLSLARSLQVDPRPELIFVTGTPSHAAAAFEVDAADYVLKPVEPARLREAITRVRRRLGSAPTLALRSVTPPSDDGRANEIWVKSGGVEVRVRADQIVWVEAAGDYVMVHTAVRNHLVRGTISSVAELFSPTLLRRVHRSALVNLSAVTSLQRRGGALVSLVLADEIEVPVGRNYTSETLSALKSVGS